MNDPFEPAWAADACKHATKYLTLFANNPGVEKIVKEFDPKYLQIQDPNMRLDYLAELAAKEWDFRKGRERYEITETFPIDSPDSNLGRLIHEGARQAEMASPSTATLDHYNIMAILGGANRSPYNRLKYALEQHVTYDMLVFLGSEREVLTPEQEQTKDYAPGARTEFDLGIGAIQSLLGDQIVGEPEYEVISPDARIAHFKRKDNIPMMVMSAPPNQGGKRANTADTYDFLRQYQKASLDSTQNILFATAAMYRYAQYFDAVREILLKTGTDIEVIGYEPSYADMEFKPSQFLQELKSAATAAVRLRDAVRSLEETQASDLAAQTT